MTLFDQNQNISTMPPLADRLRPTTVDDFLGQQHLLDDNRIIRKIMKSKRMFSLILWGPPGCGKTTLARLVASEQDSDFHEISAVSAGVKDVRATLDKARANREMGKPTLLFIDEIHRFNKAQQDALLHAVENGIITLIGATTENPSFEVISPLLSRCQVLRLNPLDREALESIFQRAFKNDLFLSTLEISIDEDAREYLIQSVSGDARRLLNALEISVALASAETKDNSKLTLTEEIFREALQAKHTLYDKAGDYHYDSISAFIKSVRGSDPDAALYWLSVMIEGGEDPLFLARRLIILASEDIGNADPQALTLANSAFQAVHAIGMPEGAIVLAQATTYLASTAKSNASYMGLRAAQKTVSEEGALPVPLSLRNAPTSLMKDQDFGKGYVYPHSQPGHFMKQSYFPGELKQRHFYLPSQEGLEKRIYDRLKSLWPDRNDKKQG